MLILGIETSARAGSVALLLDDVLLADCQLAAESRSAQSLTPAIGQILSQAGHQIREIGLVATTVGPGSFTGLRVGVTTAKTLAYALGCEVIGLDTLDVIACQVAEDISGRTLHCVLDAQREELFAATYAPSAGGPRRLEASRIVPSSQWLASLTPETAVSGPGLARLVARLPVGVVVADRQSWEPQAVSVGRLAQAEHQRGRRDDLWKLAPAYMRASAAEEKAARAN